ncbi:MAG TPA: hypothetical protein VE911_09415 [Candidatus Nitrosopolaris sp.]|nr:hypothetical protein [Candidatus Nitrosopolaris sp.]
MIRVAVLTAIWMALARLASAQCPATCLPGGGSPRTDCVIEWGGVSAMTASCVDGTACDQDGAADGTCTFPLVACLNVTGSADCTPGTLAGPPTVKPTKTPAAQALASALAALAPSGHDCTPPGVTVPLKVGLSGIKAGAARMRVSAVSGGLRDSDKLALTCQPNPTPPSFAGAVQPILSAKCALPSCHSGPSPSGGQNLEPGRAYAESVGVASVNVPNLMRIEPGSIKKSYLARKILGQGIGPTSRMPQGCPAVIPPVPACLTDAEVFTILSWIQGGAPDN